ncbi:radical SAM family heme chaperone HemW [Sagittula salina]|uniref:Heme chaperone HemW n=1 Tax=Sagittula salina TaxID=2820268 RepID=A0A940MK68_9RHOB|nr:radical SAM family heme chaperone HemW [Sagittula salina]MBP0483310.1 coproporphyrinogen III oxidase [Sagittula salina]
MTQPENWQTGGFGLYVHWPFCEAKCPYCDFNSHVVASVDQRPWAEALAAEIRRYAEAVPGRVLTSIFFGGGTPSLMAPETVATVIGAARGSWTFANDIEITLEANPRSVEAARFEGYARAGVNRVSLGVQSLREDDLRKLGRLHDVKEAQAAFGIAREVFDRVSFDLIYARQGQNLRDWEEELGEALEMAVDHLSLYQLTVEPGTAFWDRAQKGRLKGLPTEDLGADMYELTQELCAGAGMPAYEVSNHAPAGSESRHNLVYWRYGDWIGVGPGAHGRFSVHNTRYETIAHRMPGVWLPAAQAGNGDLSRDVVPMEDQAIEYLIMGLRLSEGVDLERLHNMSRSVAPDAVIEELTRMGLLRISSHQLKATLEGRMVLNSVIEKLVP